MNKLRLLEATSIVGLSAMLIGCNTTGTNPGATGTTTPNNLGANISNTVGTADRGLNNAGRSIVNGTNQIGADVRNGIDSLTNNVTNPMGTNTLTNNGLTGTNRLTNNNVTGTGTTANNLTTTRNNLKTSIINATNTMNGVKDITVVTEGNTAYVACNVDTNVRGLNTTTLKNQIVNAVKNSNPNITRCYIINDKAGYDRLNMIERNTLNGQTTAAHTTELRNLVTNMNAVTVR